MKEIELESCQPGHHNYKTVEQPHVEIANILNLQFDVAAPNFFWCSESLMFGQAVHGLL